jgi:hypothetical protein
MIVPAAKKAGRLGWRKGGFMARVKTEKAVFTFPTTTQAMHMEQCCKAKGRPGRLIPVPVKISAGCGMAWCAPLCARLELEQMAKEEKIEMEGVYELLL